MKLKLLFVLLMNCANMLQAQTLETLKPEALKFYEGHYYMDFNEIAGLTYPKIIETANKENFIKKLDSDYQNTVYRKRLQLVHPVFGYSAIKKIDGISFCIITYKNPTRYSFEQKLDTETASQKTAELKQSTKATEVIFEPIRNSINVKYTSKIIAVADSSTGNNWKFFNFDDPAQEEIFRNIFNENIKKTLGL
ncbi:hypothetical protein FNO01nite_12250 [Flavobacterium noncentrifugens]|uniref:DUF4468 domain-containing protein n=1 Tax=Flavobacterium noncentrifugens TaxID=1128970 RepID=A0A1G8VKM8_9FLAO|nr:hypothetical protein [Flavobacterium noncentrifugens]GEP50553.1 hypothetical protein FNO01nite_12250 [Flavobacterium noncentrifugens]SDJ66646.1 hypothetical protein SAMN04487935_1414 [Flavobacterium noncentrifugens]